MTTTTTTVAAATAVAPAAVTRATLKGGPAGSSGTVRQS